MKLSIQIDEEELTIEAEYIGVFSDERDHFQYMVTLTIGNVSYCYNYNAPHEHFKQGNFELSDDELIETALYGLEAAYSGSGTFEGYMESMGYDISNVTEFEQAKSEYEACALVYKKFEKADYLPDDINSIIESLIMETNDYFLSLN